MDSAPSPNSTDNTVAMKQDDGHNILKLSNKHQQRAVFAFSGQPIFSIDILHLLCLSAGQPLRKRADGQQCSIRQDGFLPFITNQKILPSNGIHNGKETMLLFAIKRRSLWKWLKRWNIL